MLNGMTTQQIAVRVPSELLERVDDLVRAGRCSSRAEAVRVGLAALTERHRQQLIDEEIRDGYRRDPPGESDDAAARASLRASIAEEPW
ncbi:hypothetical protein BH20ACT2_BH20ACT2_18160 [soil metagenome]